MRTGTLKSQHDFWLRSGLIAAGLAILAGVYIFQRMDLAGFLGNFHPNVRFIINRTVRLILNDTACFLIIMAVFREPKYLKIAFVVFLIEILVLFPFYLAIKLILEGASEISSPLLSQVHRLVVNPMLMFLLMAGFLYQRLLKR